MKAHWFVGMFAVALVACVTMINAEDKADSLSGVTCPVSGKKINPEATADYKDGKVYFCCPGCPGAFAGNTTKFATKANHQLVATGQYVEKACPLAGKKLNPETAVDVGGVEVSFCCNGCKGKVEKAEGDAKLDLVFADAPFAKGFEKKAE